MTPSNRQPPDSGARRKSVLYCSDCGHASPIDGDWCVERETAAPEPRTGETRERADVTGRERAVYSCPDCGTVITVRFVRGLVRA